MHQRPLAYLSDKPAPYVYKLTHRDTGKVYFGSRWVNITPSSDDIFMYRSSSKAVKPIFDEFDVVVVAEFLDKDAAYDFEQQCISEMWGDKSLINASCFHNGKRFRNAGGYELDESTKIKMRKPKSADAVTNMITARNMRTDHHSGWKWSAEAKIKGSIAQTGRIVTDEQKEKISNTIKAKGITPPKILCSCSICRMALGTNTLRRHKCK